MFLNSATYLTWRVCVSPKTPLYTHTTHTYTYDWFSGNQNLAAKLGTWIIHFDGVYSYDVPRNIAISRPKTCKKSYTTGMGLYRLLRKKIELPTNASVSAPYSMHTTPRMLNQRFLDLGISPLMSNSTYLKWSVCVTHDKHTLYRRTHTHTHTHTLNTYTTLTHKHS